MSAALELEIAQLLASRICHDLISPVAAVNNGLELLQEKQSADMHERALELIQNSAQTASAKLQIMRAAFGAGHTLSEQTSPEDLSQLLNELMVKNKTALIWQNLHQDTFSRDESRLLLNILLLCCEILPRGGEIHISSLEPKGLEFTLKGSKVIFPDQKKDCLLGGDVKPSEPRLIGLYLIRLFAEKVDLNQISIEHQPTEATLRFGG